jgi:hypothetical protein
VNIPRGESFSSKRLAEANRSVSTVSRQAMG